jgi:hypothetical protein
MEETVQRIEPARLEEASEAISDALAELVAASAILGSSLHPRTAANLADLVRIMNTYYSNLIEGHDTRPGDIERALAGNSERTRSGATSSSKPPPMFGSRRRSTGSPRAASFPSPPPATSFGGLRSSIATPGVDAAH